MLLLAESVLLRGNRRGNKSLVLQRVEAGDGCANAHGRKKSYMPRLGTS
jgi:hypothetical protein